MARRRCGKRMSASRRTAESREVYAVKPTSDAMSFAWPRQRAKARAHIATDTLRFSPHKYARKCQTRNFCVDISFYSTQSRTKGSSHGGTCECPKCRLGRPGQGTGSSRGGQRGPRQRGRSDRQVPEEAALHDFGADAGGWLSARGHLGTLAGGRNR